MSSTFDRTPNNMSTSLRRTGSVTRSRCTVTPSSTSTKRSSASFATSTSMDLGSTSASVESGLRDETAGLRKIIDGLNRTNASLRTRISELEKLIEHNTGPEVERLSKELSTLEDLFAGSQRDNEAQYAESERQKLYIKEMKNLLNSNLGSDWQHSHNLYPPAPTTTIVTPSTPLPPPKQSNVHILRHSVSFSSKRPTSKLHRRASSVMDLGHVNLQAVKEDEVGMDDTPTGALRKLSGSTSSTRLESLNNRKKEEMVAQYEDDSQPKLLTTKQDAQTVPSSTCAQKQPSNPDSNLNSSSAILVPTALSGVDINQLNRVLQLLSSLTPATLSELSRSKEESEIAERSRPYDEKIEKERKEHIGTMRKMLENQQQLLKERESRLSEIIRSAQEKERQYSSLAI
ncbi:uncharacterized protein IL334_002347 [Kwoniella shivajii]|uniref:Uncharacterized protein n=1 Tax=Kwoniella shivajii TaxID=564305 RepID=A0ABZ1CW74_9TREE|nr:hypothetical protein IL334_002347 [Kwoniella shivajii]